MWSRNIDKEKELIDKELAVYRKEQELEINKDIQSRKEINWKEVDNARVNRLEKTEVINKEVALLEARKETLQNQIKEVSLRITEMEKNASQKDAEIARLTSIISDLIKALPNSVTVSQQDPGSNIKWGQRVK